MRAALHLASALAISLAALSCGSLPGRGYECLAPANPGGGWDLTCRAASQVFNELGLLPQPMRVENLPGAGGGIAFAHAVAYRKGDERLIVAASPSTTLRLAESQFGDFEAKDVRWLGAIATDFGVIAVASGAPWKDLHDLVEAWKSRPEEVVVAGGSAVGGQDHMRVLLLGDASGIGIRKIRYVPFDGGGEALTALLGGFVEVVPLDASEILSHYRAGGVRLLAVLSPERLPEPFEDVPTAREQGYDVTSMVWRGFYAPSGIPENVYASWVEALAELESSESWSRVRSRFGLLPFFAGGTDFEALVDREVQQFRELTRRLGLVK